MRYSSGLALCVAFTQSVLAIDFSGLLSKAVPAIDNSPWYEKTYEFSFVRKPVKARPVDFRFEALLVAVALSYFVIHLIGRTRNRGLARTWLDAAMPLLEDEFAFVGKEENLSHPNQHVGEGKGKLIWNGHGEALAYASGRRGVDGLQILFTFAPFHDPIEFVWNQLYSMAFASTMPSMDDTIALTFQLPYQQPDNTSGVFGIANKSNLRASRQGRFDLTFAKVLDSGNVNEQRQLHERFAIMSEAGELTDVLLGEIGERGDAQRHRVGLQSALNGEAGQWLYSLILSDQPEQRPERGAIAVEARKRRLTLTMRVPRSKNEAKSSLPLVEAACNLVDALELGNARLTNATVNKLRQTRSQLDKELNEEATREQKEDEEEARQAAKRKADQEKFDKLSPAEQEKRKQVEKKRQQRKSQGKTVKGR
jgi:hypothetical protein